LLIAENLSVGQHQTWIAVLQLPLARQRVKQCQQIMHWQRGASFSESSREQ
jgi:hypothetical protein